MPKIADIQETPNPNAVKFILKEPVSHGTSHSFPNADEAAGDEPIGEGEYTAILEEVARIGRLEGEGPDVFGRIGSVVEDWSL